MKSVSLKSFAKINIFLHILGKREDGYHDLYTLFTKTGLHDTLNVSFSDDFRITCDNPDIPTDEKNIISRVHAVLREKFGITDNFHTHIEKRIPDGGGLGGGSSNAASYLKAVVSLLDMQADIKTMTEVMSAVGSDTAFFLYDEPMTGEGRGEILKPYGKLPEGYAVILNPCIHVSTAQVFASGKITLTDRSEVNKIRHALNFSDYGEILFNGLESAVLDDYPSVRRAKDILLDSGADFALMSGSGASVFGLVPEKSRAEKIAEAVRSGHPEWKCYLTELTVR